MDNHSAEHLLHLNATCVDCAFDLRLGFALCLSKQDLQIFFFDSDLFTLSFVSKIVLNFDSIKNSKKKAKKEPLLY